MKKTICISLLTALLSSCVLKTNLGDFTLMSVNNVGDLNSVKSKAVFTEGESCIKSILFITIGSVNGRQKEATRNAIKNGRNDLPNGNVLIDSVVDSVSYLYPFYQKHCIKVSGNLVSFSKNK
jgi:hypothetical protein